MLNKFLIFKIFAILSCFSLVAQSKKDKTKLDILENVIIEDSIVTRSPINPLAPAKAAFYSAILPGLGQAYNKKYWKIPIVYVALGTGIYIYINNNNEYNRYRDAYKSRLAGFENDEFYFDATGNKLIEPRVSFDGLQRAQKLYRRNKELSLLISIGLYALNIIDANVDAHLLQYNVDENLALVPQYRFNDFNAHSNMGISLQYKF